MRIKRYYYTYDDYRWVFVQQVDLFFKYNNSEGGTGEGPYLESWCPKKIYRSI